jgi:hypothetical protein
VTPQLLREIGVAAAIAATFIVAACSTTWHKPGASETEFLQDQYACEMDARLVAGRPDDWGVRAALQHRCLKLKGWRAE